ncbi:sigma E protease regulator RseP [Pseudaeromonas sp. ZJS20]|uniref:sigma E protease regulator RseP n=1 Tax=Pseudaeromonas aegiceratis TaxID=3153928 RepID=UPI00390C8C49
MTAVLWNLASFVVALAILIAVHEWGHFYVARLCGVRVLRFSLGFGKVLWSRKDRYGTEFSLSLIPLGGYVKMLDGRVEPLAPGEEAEAFDHKRVAKRFAIVAAGPLANFVFALFAFWLMFLIGVPAVRPVVATVTPQSIAAQAGVQPQMEILQVDGRDTQDWESVAYGLVRRIGERDTALTVRTAQGDEQTVTLPLDSWHFDPEQESPILSLGIEPLGPTLTLTLAQVVPGSPGEQAGLQAGDTLLTLDGQPITDWSYLVNRVQDSPDTPLTLTFRRDGQERQTVLTPVLKEQGQRVFGFAGLAPSVEPLPEQYRFELRYGPIKAVGEALDKTANMIGLTVTMLGKLLTGILSLDNLSGPISIAKGAGSSAEFGLVYFLGFLALVSVNLGIINLFPLPILDGGHLLFYLVEAVTGRPVPEKFQEYAFKFGAAILVCLMAIALFNDFARL